MTECPFIVPAVLDDAGFDVYLFRALAHVARRAGTEGVYYGSGTRSAALCRMSLRRFRSAIGRGVKLGLLEILETTPGKPTVYRLRLDRCTTCTSAPDTPVHEVPGTGARGAQGSAPGAGVPVHDVHTKESRKGIPSRSPEKESLLSPDGEASSDPIEVFPTATDAEKETTDRPKVEMVEAVLLPMTAPKGKTNGSGLARETPWQREAAACWLEAYGDGIVPKFLFPQLKPAVDRYTWARVRPVLELVLAETPDVQYLSLPKALGTFVTLEERVPLGPRRGGKGNAASGNIAVLSAFVNAARAQ
jgi:hypothetical protein